jgi:hypothetical protein
MAFNKKYLEQRLTRLYGFSVELDATGMAYNAWCEAAKHPHDVIKLAGPCSDRNAALQCGIAELVDLFANGKLAAVDFEEATHGRE